MRNAEISSHYCTCAKGKFTPFYIATGSIHEDASGMAELYDGQIKNTRQFVDGFKATCHHADKPKPFDKDCFTFNLGLLQMHRNARLLELDAYVTKLLWSLMDSNSTDSLGHVQRLLCTKAQKEVLVTWIAVHFPELKYAPKDRWSNPTKYANDCVTFLTRFKGSDE